MTRTDKTAILLGASGLIGSFLLSDLLNNDNYKRVIVFARKNLGVSHHKLEVHIIDFDDVESYKNQVVGDDLFCCLGTTIKQAKTNEAFRKVDYGYPLRFAEIAKANGVHQYLLVSSIGANANSSIFYLKTKGECEQAIGKLGFTSFSIFRPASLLGNRKESRLNEKLSQPLLKAFSFLLVGKLRKYKGIQASHVAQSMCRVAQERKVGINIYESDQI